MSKINPVAKECPKKAYAQPLSMGVNKTATLRSNVNEILGQVFSMSGPLLRQGMTKAKIDQIIDTVFATNSTRMYAFEAEAEAQRLHLLINRMIDYLRPLPYTVVDGWFEETLMFLGEKHQKTVHMLWDCGDHFKAVQFKYKEPEFRYAARTELSKPENSYDLYALQAAGEVHLQKKGMFTKPVFGAIYYLKSIKDKNGVFSPYFEDNPSYNIIDLHFDARGLAKLEKFYKGSLPDRNGTPCKDGLCRECYMNEICHLEFTPRKLMEQPEKQRKVINDIQLTTAQEQFVNFNNGICRCIACAGTGKTTIITLRTLALIEEGCSPEEILMITFTDKAANEMKDRLRQYAEGSALNQINLPVDKVVVETFNSWGQHVLEAYYQELGFTSPPTVVDDVLKKDIILDILDYHRGLPLDYRNPFLRMKNAVGAVTTIVKIMDTLKANHVATVHECERWLNPELKPFAAEILDMYNEYNAKLVANNSIDYEDQLRLILELQSKGALQNLPYRHIVIDEFQDSNPNQIDLILSIMKQNAGVQSLAVVGDEMQAIYGFRNATPDNIINFDKYFKHVTDICLEDNFRSETPIIARANAILRKESAVNKQIKCWKKSPGLAPVVMTFSKPADEIDLYVRQVDKLLKDGVRASDIAILARTRNELIKIQEAFSEAKIPTILKVPEIVGDSPYVKAIIALAHFLRDPQDLLDLALYAKSVGTDPMDLKAVEQLGVDIVTAMSTMTEAEKILAFFDLTKTHTEDYIADSFMEELREHQFHTLYQLCEYCAKYRKYEIKESHSTSREETEAVTLITVHSAKGLEWDTVLLSIKKFYTDAEERRLLYVAITRAKHRLLVTADPQQDLLLDLLMKD